MRKGHATRTVGASVGMIVALVVSLLAPMPSAGAAPACATSGPGGYQVTVCISAPADGATVSGENTVTGTANATGSSPGVQRMRFYIDGGYMLTDYQAPYTFTLPTQWFVDGTHALQLSALMRDGYETSSASIDLTFSNGVTTPPVNTNQFQPTQGSTPAPGQPFVLAATGDGASGEANALSVTNMLAGWDPNLFLYLGDVYEKGTPVEFRNWYGDGSSYFGRLRSVTNPTVGNHEYEGGVAPGYFDYWDNVPHYYSFDANGWHIINLDSTSQFDQVSPGSPQYSWLDGDLAASSAACTIVFFHHPVYSVGPQGDSPELNDIWRLLADRGVDIVLTGHDHSYQRWEPLDRLGNPDPGGVTQFVVGTGGHAIQGFVRSDPRLEAGADTAPAAYGALKLQLNAGGAGFTYESYQGAIVDSGVVPCSGASGDITPPTPPTNLVGSASSASSVDLSWDPSTDDTGVVGHEIERDGTVIDSTGALASYQDISVAGGTPYTYRVRSLDAAGNHSEWSNSVEVTPPAPSSVVFADGFESGGLSQWTTVAGLTASQVQVATGSWAARGVGPPDAQATKTFAATYPELFYRIRFRLASQNSNLYLQRVRSASNTSLLGVYVTSSGKLAYRNDVSGASRTSSTVVTKNAWHELQIRVKVAGSSGSVTTWFDGNQVNALTRTENLGTAPIGRIQLGENAKNRTFDVAFDDVVAATALVAPPPDGTPPSTPQNLTADATTATTVDLSWAASNDDTGVTGYEIERNGSVFGVPAQTGYTDTSVVGSTEYTYRVRAVDAAGNESGWSDPDVVTTPEASPAVFADGFESGGLGQWTTVNGLATQQAFVANGVWAARGVGPSAAEAQKTLPTTYTDLYYRIRFRIASQASTVNVLKLRTASGSSIVGAFVSSTGKLGFRNDVAAISRTSSTSVSTGAWHELQLHVTIAGTSSFVETWFDGSIVGSLTRVEDLGTTAIGRVQLGENSTNRTFDIAFDDVEVAAAFIA